MRRNSGPSAILSSLFLAVISTLVSCNGADADPETRTFIAHFEGRIGKKERLSADVLCVGSELSGYVQRGRGGKPMAIRGRVEGVSFGLAGEDPRDQAGSFSGRLSEDGKGLKGEWIAADGSIKSTFTLKLETKKALAFQASMQRARDSGGFDAVLALAEPAKASKEFMKIFRADFLGGNPLSKEAPARIEALRARRASMGAEGPFSYRRQFVPYRNYAGVLSLFDVEEFRTNEGFESRKRLSTYSWQKGRALALKDVLKPGKAAALDEAITATLKLVYSLGPAGSLGNLGFHADSVGATDSFGLAEDGILFFFPAGTQADRGLGDVSVYLPSSLVGDLMRDGVFKR